MTVHCKTRNSELVDGERLYTELWRALKADNTVTFVAPVEYHTRILKGVSQEKWRDIFFKDQCLEAGGKVAYFRKKISGTQVTLKMFFRVGLL